MGASSYSGKGSASQSRPSYSGKNSTNYSGKSSTKEMVKMLELLQEVERCRDIVTARQADLDSAKKDLERAERNVSAQINNLDPETKARFRRMMGGLDIRENGQDENER